MDKIIQFIKLNKHLVIIISGVLLVILVIIFSLISRANKNNISLVEQPLYFYKSMRIEINDELKKSNTPPRNGLNIYKIKQENQNIRVEGILSALQINAVNKTNIANIRYEWRNIDGDLITYDVMTQDIYVSLVNRKNVFPNIAIPSDDQLKTMFPEFAKKYIDSSYEYYDYVGYKKDNEYVLEGRRKINNLPLATPGMYKYHDRIILDDKLQLKMMYVTLFNLGEVQSKLKLINGKQLANVIGNPNYPKQVNPGLPEGLIFDSADVIDAKYQERYSAEELPSPTSYKADSLELVYLFSNTNQQFLAPVYQITGKGRIVFKGNDFNVPGLINASAIDPDYVYIPSNILYAD